MSSVITHGHSLPLGELSENANTVDQRMRPLRVLVGAFLVTSFATTLGLPEGAVVPIHLTRWLVLMCASIVAVNHFLRLPISSQGAAWLLSGLYAAGTIVYTIDIPATALRSTAFIGLAAAAFLGGSLCYQGTSSAPHRLPSRIAIAVTCLAIASIVGFVLGAPASFFHETGLLRGVFCHANAMGAFGAMWLVVCVGVYDSRLSRHRNFIVVGVIAMTACLLASKSRAGFGGAMIGVLFYLLVSRRTGRLFVVGMLLTTALLAAFVLLPFAANVATREGGDFVFKGNEGDFLLSRRDLWEEGWENFLSKPWFGYGFGTSVGQEMKEWRVVGLGGREKGSALIAILEETGVVGTVVMGLPLLLCMANGLRLRRLNIRLAGSTSDLASDAKLAAAFWAGTVGGIANNLAEGSLWSPGSPYGGMLLFLAGAAEGLMFRTEGRTEGRL